MPPPSSGRLPPTHSLLLVHVFIKRNRNKSCSSDCPFSTFRLLIISGAELANLQHGDQGLAQVQGFWCLYFESYRCLDFLFWILWAVIRKRRCAPYSRVLQPPGSNIWGGADVIIIEIKCSINAMHLNHPETIYHPAPPCPQSMEKLSSIKLIPGAKKVGDWCPRMSNVIPFGKKRSKFHSLFKICLICVCVCVCV